MRLFSHTACRLDYVSAAMAGSARAKEEELGRRRPNGSPAACCHAVTDDVATRSIHVHSLHLRGARPPLERGLDKHRRDAASENSSTTLLLV
jgi:hypothetical protein